MNTDKIVEIASDFAHEVTKEILDMTDANMWVEDSRDSLIYTPEVQDLFNEWYDYFYGELELKY